MGVVHENIRKLQIKLYCYKYTKISIMSTKPNRKKPETKKPTTRKQAREKREKETSIDKSNDTDWDQLADQEYQAWMRGGAVRCAENESE